VYSGIGDADEAANINFDQYKGSLMKEAGKQGAGVVPGIENCSVRFGVGGVPSPRLNAYHDAVSSLRGESPPPTSKEDR
jgi:hypothetical protein